jgi:hypothetical protein
MATPSQVEANRANAQFSTGPSSPEGKLKVSHNALKTGLTGRTILLPSDDVAAYQNFTAITYNKWQPATDEEKLLVQSMLAEQAPTGRPETIVDTEWRLLRIPTIESALFGLGRNEFSAEVSHEPNDQARAAALDAIVYRAYRKDFSNLALQENRLNRQLAKHTAELNQLQSDRELLVNLRRNEAMVAFQKAKIAKQPFDAAVFGFEFSNEYLSARCEAFRQGSHTALPAFDRAWKTKLRSEPRA